jgi:hypothetical protein
MATATQKGPQQKVRGARWTICIFATLSLNFKSSNVIKTDGLSRRVAQGYGQVYLHGSSKIGHDQKANRLAEGKSAPLPGWFWNAGLDLHTTGQVAYHDYT